MSKRVVLAMSGGVDSSVAAHLLLEQGFQVVGIFMRHGESSPAECRADGLDILSDCDSLTHKQGCCTASDARDAQRIAHQLDIPFYSLNLQQEFGEIMAYFSAEYLAGRTPNPCVMCNNWIKFGKLFAYADSVQADFVATGHYARLQRTEDDCHLLRGVDSKKDQSYVLFGISRNLLGRMLLPVGNYEKHKIRAIAESMGMSVAEKKDSQEICFVTQGHHSDFIRRHHHNLQTSGDIITTAGRIVGQHSGYEQFTVGQRRGLGVAMGEPYFVTRIDSDTNEVVIGRHDELAVSELTADQTNWLVETSDSFPCLAQIRYNSRAVPAVATRQGEQLRIRFEDPCFGVAPGQAVVCYDGDQVLGGGWIKTTTPAE
ncbi:MAG: tRNA 2-thiouridine(34) synthase MnmA [Planctomycetales bacterium]|nr:tRNA 2-thiouridine(34) synthase MnmA [Planctomycetales bacterium]